MSAWNLRGLLIAGLFTVAACGGGAATPTGPVTQASGAATSGPPAATDAAVATTDPGGGGTIDTCSLLSAAALKTATGDDYGDGVDDGYGQCTYRVGGATANDGKGQIVVAVVDTPLSTIKSTFGAGGVDLTVAGKTAFWNPTAGLQTLWVDLGARALAISFDPVTAETLAIAEKVAAAAVAGL